MTQASLKFARFEDYLTWREETESVLPGQFELIDGELIEVPPESGPNDAIANRLFFWLVASGVVPLECVRPGKCEVQVPVLRPGDAANRFPDLVILDRVHLELTQQRLTITLDMPPPRIVVEVLSPGKQNRDRDRVHKQDQYAARAIPEYWLIDPEAQTVEVLSWREGQYEGLGMAQGSQRIVSRELAGLQLTAEQIF